MNHGTDIKSAARLIFADALRAVESGSAARRAVEFSGAADLIVAGEVFQITRRQSFYVIAAGKVRLSDGSRARRSSRRAAFPAESFREFCRTL